LIVTETRGFFKNPWGDRLFSHLLRNFAETLFLLIYQGLVPDESRSGLKEDSLMTAFEDLRNIVPDSPLWGQLQQVMKSMNSQCESVTEFINQYLDHGGDITGLLAMLNFSRYGTDSNLLWDQDSLKD
jgi:hypothetical protein